MYLKSEIGFVFLLIDNLIFGILLSIYVIICKKILLLLVISVNFVNKISFIILKTNNKIEFLKSFIRYILCFSNRFVCYLNCIRPFL